jgi:hypothetical protein
MNKINRVLCDMYLCMALLPFVGPWPLFEFLDLLTQLVGLLGRGSARRKAATYTQDSIYVASSKQKCCTLEFSIHGLPLYYLSNR